jgi:hypothetical protein
MVNKIGGASSLQQADPVACKGVRALADIAGSAGSGHSPAVYRVPDLAWRRPIDLNESDHFKRVVGLRGDHVVCCDHDVTGRSG